MTDASDQPARTSEVARRKVAESTRIEVWAKSAGRCCICARYMIGATGFFHTTLVGEVAHLTGASSGGRSPRGASRQTAKERAQVANLMLLCHECHKKVDSHGMAGYYTREMLASIKERHEARVRSATDFATHGPAMVLSVAANIRGTRVAASDRQISETLRQSSFSLATADPRDSRFEVDLPDAESVEWSWQRAEAEIQTKTLEVLNKARAGDSATVVVFAVGPIPTLVLLGYYLDDKSDVRVMPASRRDDDSKWLWSPKAEERPEFDFEVDAADAAAEEVVVAVDISAVTSPGRAPAALTGAPVLRLRSTPTGPQVIESREALESFGRVWRRAMATIEERFPSAKRVHLVAAVPAVAAVEIGRAYMRDSQPELVVYQRSNLDEYVEAVRLR